MYLSRNVSLSRYSIQIYIVTLFLKYLPGIAMLMLLDQTIQSDS